MDKTRLGAYGRLTIRIPPRDEPAAVPRRDLPRTRTAPPAAQPGTPDLRQRACALPAQGPQPVSASRRPHAAAIDIHVGRRLYCAGALWVAADAGLVVNRAGGGTPGLFTDTVEGGLVMVMSGAGRSGEPGLARGAPPAPVTALLHTRLTGDALVRFADAAHATFAAEVAGPVSVRIGVSTLAFEDLVEDALERGDDALLASLEARCAAQSPPPRRGLDGRGERIMDAHNLQADRLAKRYGGRAFAMAQDAVFVAASGELDVFEEGPVVSRVVVPATGVRGGEPGAKRARHEHSHRDLRAGGPDEGFRAWARDSKLAQECATPPGACAPDPGEEPKTG